MKLKNIKKQNTMKTRIFTMTAIILFTAATIAGAANHREKSRSASSFRENATGQITQEMKADQSVELKAGLEQWITDRENWEQEGEEMTVNTGSVNSTMLYEWVVSRDNWEQEGEEMITATTSEKRISLEEWIAGRESWEQEGQETSSSLVRYELTGMEEWIAAITEWEQK
jgi:hypothetical protein